MVNVELVTPSTDKLILIDINTKRILMQFKGEKYHVKSKILLIYHDIDIL